MPRARRLWCESTWLHDLLSRAGGCAACGGSASKLDEGARAFSEGQFDRALKLLDGAGARNGRTRRRSSASSCCAGSASRRGQDFSKAEEAFALALDANPEASLDPRQGRSRRLVRLLESMRARLSGSIAVHTSPSGAQVLIDGAAAGATPLSKDRAHRPSQGADHVERRRRRPAARSARAPTSAESFVEWVEVKTEKQVIVEKPVFVERPVAPVAPPKVHFYADLRGVLDVNAGPEGGLDLGAGIEVPQAFLRFQLSARLYPVLSRHPPPCVRRAALGARLERLRRGRVLARFNVNGTGLGVGGSAGVEWSPRSSVRAVRRGGWHVPTRSIRGSS